MVDDFDDTLTPAARAKASMVMSKTDQVHARLRDDIVSGRYQPGAPISERSLAEENDMSRVPVREALIRLERDGLVDSDWGMTESGRKAKFYRITDQGRRRLRAEAREFAGFVKLVSDTRYDEVLGVHMVGPRVTDLIAEACAALRLESTTEDLLRTIHPHPTLSEAVGEAAHVTEGHPLHI